MRHPRTWNRLAALVTSALALMAPACGGDTERDGAATKSEPLCDGSDSIRFFYTAGGGMVEPSYGFTNPHGFDFLVVTGTCQAFAGGDYMHGWRSITLSDAQAQDLAKAVGRSQIAAWSKYTDEQSCPDAGSTSISDGKSHVACSCGCDPGMPAAIQAALEQAATWRANVISQGTPLSGSVAAAALPDPNPLPNLKTFPWPLASPITDLPSPIGSKTGKLISDPTEAAALRQLRTTVSGYSGYPSYVPVEDASTARFQLYVRDELPANVEAALAALE